MACHLLVTTDNYCAAIHGHGNNVKKFEGYKVLAANAPNTLTLSDKALHARRRRVISQAFSEACLRLFEPAVRSRINRFCQVLRSHSQSGGEWTDPLDMSLRCMSNPISPHDAMPGLGPTLTPTEQSITLRSTR